MSGFNMLTEDERKYLRGNSPVMQELIENNCRSISGLCCDIWEDNWNPDAHMDITFTIDELRTLTTVLKLASKVK